MSRETLCYITMAPWRTVWWKHALSLEWLTLQVRSHVTLCRFLLTTGIILLSCNIAKASAFLLVQVILWNAVIYHNGYSITLDSSKLPFPHRTRSYATWLSWQPFIMGFAVRVRSAGQKYGPTCHQRDRADVTEFVTLVRLSSLGQHVGVLTLAGYKRRKSALTANPVGQRGTVSHNYVFLIILTSWHVSVKATEHRIFWVIIIIIII